MATTKSALKAAKNALDAHNYSDAIENANKVLVADANNYHAYVLSALFAIPKKCFRN